MSESVYEISAYAKINLFLKILGQLPNGYHKLYTIMQETDLADGITVVIEDGGSGKITVTDPQGRVLPEDNLCYIAADKFLGYMARKDRRSNRPSISIVLDKHIPSQSGMGGGSSDAAAVLLVLQQHFNEPFDDGELTALATSIGADVPFFLYGGTCLCEGVGEDITVLREIEGADIVLAKPEQGVSTAECFRLADKSSPDEDVIAEYKEFARSLTEDADGKAGITELIGFLNSRKDCPNDLQRPAESLVPVISDLIGEMRREGAAYAGMTGSGSAVFGIFLDNKSAEAAKDSMSRAHEQDGTEVFYLRTI